MKNQKNDRRSKRTRRSISDALIELMLEKNYDTITVQDIIDRANVGRSTFYAHYLDKEDLLTSQLEQLMNRLHEVPLTKPSEAIFASLGMFQHVAEARQLYKAFLWGKGIEMIFEILQGIISQQIEKELAVHLKERTPSVPTVVIATYITGGFLTLLRWWLDNGMPYPPEEINQMFEQMVIPSVNAMLSDEN